MTDKEKLDVLLNRSHGWIPVGERLPKEMQPVLAWSAHGNVCETARWTGYRWEATWDYEEFSGVTHWQPLPHPPQS